jgi:hypothetical protein
MYASYGLVQLKQSYKKIVFIVLVLFMGINYLNYPILLMNQFRKDTPKSAAYQWVKANIPVKETLTPYILVYTEEGLDPLNKISGAKVNQYNVYTSESAELFYPEDPLIYDYVIVSSRPMQNFKRPEVRQKYPYYAQKWDEFEQTLQDKSKFELIKDFTLPKPSIVPLSDVFIYRKLKVISKPLASGWVSELP